MNKIKVDKINQKANEIRSWTTYISRCIKDIESYQINPDELDPLSKPYIDPVFGHVIDPDNLRVLGRDFYNSKLDDKIPRGRIVYVDSRFYDRININPREPSQEIAQACRFVREKVKESKAAGESKNLTGVVQPTHGDSGGVANRLKEVTSVRDL